MKPQTIATWLRECDQADFSRFLRPDLQLINARVAGAEAREAVNAADGLLLSGGPDISRKFLTQPVPDESLIRGADSGRDEWEFEIVRRFLEAGKPVLAVCKGLQVLNVALEGTLHLHIEGHDLPELRSSNVQPLRYARGVIPVLPAVNSSHHQAIENPGPGLEVQAWSEADGIIEQVRLKGHRYVVGVQYHPERHPDYAPLFDEFFSALKTRW